MNGIIQLLPDHIANQIAAGEVIQRPASVVKELMENAIDAGAERIQVVIKDAGKTLIQVTDNGIGMLPGDAVKCFERHATSKIQTADDLYTLTTKGFRGEALASIAAIAHVTLRTRHINQEIGTEIEMEGSLIKRNESCVCPIGTTFEIKNLFFNVPARRNFLKSEAIEWSHIVDEFERVALAHPAIHLSLKHNNQEIYELPAQLLRKRIVDILGKSSNDKLVPIEEETAIVSVHGFVGKPEASRKTRGQQFLFVNNRFFKDSYFNHAIVKAFDGLLPSKHHPSYFLYFTVDPKRIDVNVHPTKTEIKFEEDRSIYSILVSSIRQALGKYNISPTLDFEQETGFDLPHVFKDKPVTEPVIQVNASYNPFKTYGGSSTSVNREKSFSPAITAQGFGEKQPDPADWQSFYKITEEEEIDNPLIEVEPQENVINDVLLIHAPFFISTVNDNVLFVHAIRAYLRVLYDKLMDHFLHAPVSSQSMLFPFERICSSVEMAEWNSNETTLNRLGFSGRFEGETLYLDAIPSVLHADAIQDCVEQIFEKITVHSIEKSDVAHHVIFEIARSESKIKGKVSTNEEAKELMKSLLESKEPAISPDGKRILLQHSFNELIRNF